MGGAREGLAKRIFRDSEWERAATSRALGLTSQDCRSLLHEEVISIELLLAILHGVDLINSEEGMVRESKI
jgi:hypothetical protein